jgi:hypothetical protein
MYAVVEFPPKKEGGEPEVEIICESWITGSNLRFQSNSSYQNCLKKQKNPVRNWKIYAFKYLKRGIQQLENAQEQRDKYCKFSDTASDVEFMKTQRENRKHPLKKFNDTHDESYNVKLMELKSKV